MIVFYDDSRNDIWKFMTRNLLAPRHWSSRSLSSLIAFVLSNDALQVILRTCEAEVIRVDHVCIDLVHADDAYH